jgi:hypothetical protein
MNQKLKAQDLMQIIISILRSKEKLYNLLGHIDVEELEAGVISLHQDIFNESLKINILNKLEAEDATIKFNNDCIRIDIDKNIKAMMLEKIIKVKLKIYEINVDFGYGRFYIAAKYKTEFEGIPPIIEKMPGGQAIKEMAINSIIKHGVKDMPWMDITTDRINMDLGRMPAFDKIRRTGVFGIDILSTLVLADPTFKDGKMNVRYSWSE